LQDNNVLLCGSKDLDEAHCSFILVFRDWLDAALLRQEDRTLFGLSERARATP
jgi:hypothetical protein